jgi:hypothetical protein
MRKQSIQLYRGLKKDLMNLTGEDCLKEGELAFATDTKEIFIGGANPGDVTCIGGYTSGPKDDMSK